MKKQILILNIALLLVICLENQATAEVMIAHWTAVVSDLSPDRDPAVGNIWQIGDEISWSVTYDNSHIARHIYNDGPNGIGEFGENDDTLNGTYSCDTGNYCSDALFTFDEKTMQYISLMTDVNTQNSADQFQEDWRGGAGIGGGYMKDGFSMNAFWSDMKFGQFFKNSLGIDSSVLSFQVTGYSTSPSNPLPDKSLLLMIVPIISNNH